MDAGQIYYRWATRGTPEMTFLIQKGISFFSVLTPYPGSCLWSLKAGSREHEPELGSVLCTEAKHRCSFLCQPKKSLCQGNNDFSKSDRFARWLISWKHLTSRLPFQWFHFQTGEILLANASNTASEEDKRENKQPSQFLSIFLVLHYPVFQNLQFFFTLLFLEQF